MRLSESCTQRRRPQSCLLSRKGLVVNLSSIVIRTMCYGYFFVMFVFSQASLLAKLRQLFQVTFCPGREDKSILSFLKAVYIVNMNEQIINFQVKENNKKKLLKGWDLNYNLEESQNVFFL